MVRVALPGVVPGDSRIRTDGARLSVVGRRPLAIAAATVHRLEIPYGRFERTIDLPAGPLRPRRTRIRPTAACCSSSAAWHDDMTTTRHPPHRGKRSAAAVRCLDHRPRAQPRAVSGADRAGHARPRGVDCRGTGSGEGAAADRLAAAAPSRDGGPEVRDLYTVGTTATILRYLTTPDGTHNLVVQGRPALPRRRVPRGPAVPGGARRAAAGHRADHSRHRGADAAGEGARRGAARAHAAGAGASSPPRSSRSSRRAGSRTSSRVSSTSSRRRSRTILETFDVKTRLDPVLAFLVEPHRGAAAVARNRRADAGTARSPAARGPAARAAEDDPEGAGRERRPRGPKSRS